MCIYDVCNNDLPDILINTAEDDDDDRGEDRGDCSCIAGHHMA